MVICGMPSIWDADGQTCHSTAGWRRDFENDEVRGTRSVKEDSEQQRLIIISSIRQYRSQRSRTSAVICLAISSSIRSISTGGTRHLSGRTVGGDVLASPWMHFISKSWYSRLDESYRTTLNLWNHTNLFDSRSSSTNHMDIGWSGNEEIMTSYIPELGDVDIL